MKKLSVFIYLTLLAAFPAIAQEVEMADTFRSEGKIYVVVAVMAIIAVGLFGYLFYLDKKVSKLEKEEDSK